MATGKLMVAYCPVLGTTRVMSCVPYNVWSIYKKLRAECTVNLPWLICFHRHGSVRVQTYRFPSRRMQRHKNLLRFIPWGKSLGGERDNIFPYPLYVPWTQWVSSDLHSSLVSTSPRRQTGCGSLGEDSIWHQPSAETCGWKHLAPYTFGRHFPATTGMLAPVAAWINKIGLSVS